MLKFRIFEKDFKCLVIKKNTVFFNDHFNGYCDENEVIKNLKLLKKNGYKLDESISRYSFYGGNLKILKWLIHNEYNIDICDDIIVIVIHNNHLHILKWLKKIGYNFNIHKTILEAVLKTRNTEIFNFFKNTFSLFHFYKWFHIGYGIYNFTFIKWFSNINVKKVINFEGKKRYLKINRIKKKFLKTIKFKTKNNYMKGYNKN
jgi:hypothetical protein